MEKEIHQQNLSKVALKPLKDGLRPFEYSNEVSIPPLSFYDPQSLIDKGKLKKEEEPITPHYFSLEELNKPKILDKENLLKDFSKEKDGDLRLTNKDLVDRQKGILAYVIRKAASQILEGKSIVGLSLPVRIFEPRSILERLSDLWTFAPHYLTKASSEEGVERIQSVFSFLISILPITTSQWKPFNPLLGETFQGELADGTTIDCEQTSHHPPIATFYVKNKNWTAHGSWTINGNLRGNNFHAYNEGWITIEFADGGKVKFYTPAMALKGMLMGKRKLQYVSSLCVKDEGNGLKAAVKFNVDAKRGLIGMFKSSRQDTCRGMLYRYDPVEDAKMVKKNPKWYDMIKAQGEFPDIKEKISDIEGSWLESIKIGDKTTWTLGGDLQYATQTNFREYCLPSDCRFREDLIWLERGNEDQAQIWKVLLEEQQRKDRKFRKIENEKAGRGPLNH